ncbi:MAG: 2-oxoacid:acceptor oxidoreductase subunit alpha, partial [Arenimonas sp.]
ASHGETKHVLLFPEDPKECFEHAAAALDLADRLQTPIFVMSDLDIGMNQRLCEPLQWDESRGFDRGKVMTADELESGKEFGRYLDVDGDGIPYRTYPGTHPSKGSFFTRGTTKNAYAGYSEQGPDYLYNVHRLLKKFDTAKALVPQPVIKKAKQTTQFAAIYFGSTSPAMAEAIEVLQAEHTHLDTLRLRAFPFPDLVAEFIAEHKTVFIVEQNRDAQIRSLLINEFGIDPAKLVPILHYDGTPITARFIGRAISSAINATNLATPQTYKVATP